MNRTVVSLIGVKPFRIGGTEQWCRELSIRLAENGWKHVVCFLDHPSPAVREFLSLPGVQIESLPFLANPSAASARKLWQVLRRFRPTTVHMQFLGLISPFAWVAKAAGVNRIFFTDQGSKPEGYVAARRKWWKRVASRCIDFPINKVICISDYNLDCLRKIDALPKNRLCRIYNGTPLPFTAWTSAQDAEFRRHFSIPMERSIVTQVSWIIPEKGIEDLLVAAQMVIAQKPNTHFLFVGDGEYRAQYTRFAERLGIDSHITWTGIVENPLTSGVFAASEVVTQVSRWQEAFGWTIAEAMSCSKPLVATRVGGIPELVADNASGFLVERRDPAAIAERIVFLLNEPAIRTRFGLEGRRIATEKFDVKKNVEDVLSLYGVTQRASERAWATSELL
jgi:L-malate glycosyltransferase